jgi:hypothetical protein
MLTNECMMAPMAARLLMTASALVLLVFGLIHLACTFRGTKLTPRDPELQQRMKEVSPVISRETTMWKAWVGFNASHSLSVILFGLVYGYLALAHSELLFRSPRCWQSVSARCCSCWWSRSCIGSAPRSEESAWRCCVTSGVLCCRVGGFTEQACSV